MEIISGPKRNEAEFSKKKRDKQISKTKEEEEKDLVPQTQESNKGLNKMVTEKKNKGKSFFNK